MRALFLAATLAACTAPTEGNRALRDPRSVRVALETPVFVDARFSTARRDDVENALSRWNLVLGGARVFVVASDDLERPREWLGLAAHPLAWGVTVTFNATSPEGIPPLWMAQVLAGNDVQFYGDHVPSHTPYEVLALHEFGHVLGLDDNEPGAVLMRCPIDPSGVCIDVGTVAALARRRPEWAIYLQPECAP